MLDSKAIFKKLNGLSEGKKRFLRTKMMRIAKTDIWEVITIIGDQLNEIKDEDDRATVLYTAAAYMALGFEMDNISFPSALGSCSLPTIRRRYTDFLESYSRNGFDDRTVDKFDVLITFLRREGKTFDFGQFLNDLLIYREDSTVKFRWVKDFVSQQRTNEKGESYV